MALQEGDLETVTPILAVWRYGTKRGRLARLFMVLHLWWYLHLRGPRAGRLAPWYETGSVGGCLVLLITVPALHYWRHLHLVSMLQRQARSLRNLLSL